jgi:hypothetical protein
MVFKKSKQYWYFVTQENYMILEYCCSQIKFYYNTATPIHLYFIYNFYFTKMSEFEELFKKLKICTISFIEKIVNIWFFKNILDQHMVFEHSNGMQYVLIHVPLV